MKVAGFGFRSGASADSLRDALARAGGGADRVAVPADKADHPAVQALALQVIPIQPSAIHAAETLTQSSKVREKRGTGSVSEACALAALPGGRLLAPRSVSNDRMATCAIAQGEPT